MLNETTLRSAATASFRPRILRVAIVSALAAYATMLSGQAKASCEGNPNSDISGDFTYGYVVCQGATQTDGEDMSYTVDGSFKVDASDDRGLALVGNVGGVLTMYSRGGKGVDEENAGAGGTAYLKNSADMLLTGTTHAGFYKSLISVSSIGGDGDDHNDDNNSDGGDGGAGRAISIENNGALTVASTVRPEGNPLFGISAVSGGGTGGDQNGSVFGNQVGGPGGTGGAITLTNSGVITVGTSQSRISGYARGAGIHAESFGGSGGTNNGAAGGASQVQVTNTGIISVGWNADDGRDVYGIHAISAAGDGSLAEDTSDNGGAGGNAGAVIVSSSGEIVVDIDGTYTGEGAGIAALSQGGKGGTGPKTDHSGGKGGTGQSATVYLQGENSRITTRGDSLYGILIQSLGGEGGDGGDGAAMAGQGGGAGLGGNASSVAVGIDEGAVIDTSGNFSTAVIAQSVGGGGGTGGTFVSVLGGQGGNGGSGGDASAVGINSAGTINTRGDHAYGILAQSIAGSGGAGGVQVSAGVSLGGDGAGGGAAGSVSAVQTGDINTSGYAGHGIIAQSIGGGGGASGSTIGLLSVGGSAAGSTGSQGGEVAVSNVGSIRTLGNASVGLIAQSIGGGGGSGGDSLGVVTVGGSGAAGGVGGTVGVYEFGTIETSGKFSPGVLAQSIGGGGGNGGDTLAITAGATIAIGGSGSGGGDGGAVCLSSEGACDDSMSEHARKINTHGNYSPGIIAQNIGGGGGTGGSVTSVSAASFLGLQLGGSGSGGGNAGTAGTLINYKDLNITTGGAHAHGILAQSIGGGGGSGGDSSYYNATIGFNAALVMGGSGAAGGTGASTKVILENSHIATGMDYATADRDTYAPNNSFGILAQTIGGGGGNGGSSSASTFIVAVPPPEPGMPPMSFNLEAAIGGAGGGGGHACPSGDSSCLTQVALKGGSSVTTLGHGSHAVAAQSIGGGGGNGGDSSALSVGVGYGNSVSAALILGLGGSGGQASHGGKVDVAFGDAGGAYAALPATLPNLTEPLFAPSSSILTYGDFANGVLAQSIGGGGGNGGAGSSDAYSAGGLFSISLTVGVGGEGGQGGNGGEVSATLNPNFVIHTAGSGSRGMVAQSIGGGGGTSQGGTIALAAGAKGIRGMIDLNLGRKGGSGGDGAKVVAAIDGAIRTEGGGAEGVLLQSIGGGGGLGGSVGADASAHPILDRIGGSLIQKERFSDAGGAYELNVSIGGKGGTGGDGGEVQLDFGGKIATQGDWADGIVAQSIGGGGGTGGSSTAAGSRVVASISLAVGGHGGLGGDGGAVNAHFDGSHGSNILTEGYGSYGVLLQSIGGGGGLGGDGSDQASGQIAIGGSDGGNGGTAGTGGAVNAGAGSTNWVKIETLGTDAHGFMLQSIGGGGGVGGAGNSDAAVLADSHSIDLSVGGHGGSANHGGSVDVNLGAAVVTDGERSYGFVAQSIGGGGGFGGAGNASKLSSVGLGGRGGAGGDGAAVSLALTQGSSVSTHGAGAHGIVAQSIGGGGGIAGDSSKRFVLDPSGWTARDDGGQGSGNTVTLTTTDTQIITRGDNAFGIIAQSIGGGGGLGGSAEGGYAGSTGSEGSSGNGADVTVLQSGAVTAGGAGSTGIFAQSSGPDGAGVINVKVNGVVQGGTGQHANAVWIAQGKDNVLNISSKGQVLAGLDGSAVRFDGRGDTTSTLDVAVAGLLSGNVLCNNASNGVAGCQVVVEEGGEIRDANIYEAGVNNAGMLVAGKRGRLEPLTISGDYVQQAGGVLVSGVDFVERRASHLKVQGDARLNGRLQLMATSLLPNRNLTVLTVEGNTVGSLKIEESPIFNFALSQVGNEHQVSVGDANFMAGSPDLEADQQEVASHLQAIWNRGANEELGRLFAVLNEAASSRPQSYRDRLMDLSPGSALAPAGQMAAGMGNFMGAMMSCPATGVGGSIIREQNCFWGQVSRRNMNHDAGNGVPGFSFDTTTFQFGGQHQFKPNWFVGGSVAYQDSRLKGDTGRVSGRGDAGYAGVVVKHQAGPWVYSGSLAGGYGAFKLNRRLEIADYDSQASAGPKVYTAGARLRAARYFELSEQLYLKPYIDLDATYTRMPGYTESGGALGLQVDGSDQFVLGLSPTIELGGRLNLKDGATLRPYAYAGVSLLSKDSWSTVSRLRGAPSGSTGISTTLPGDKVIGKFGVGVQFSTESGLDVRLQYDGEASSKSRSHAGQLKVMYRF